MGCAKTGSGKTAAFVLPVLQKLSEEPYGIFCLVLTPTRSVLDLSPSKNRSAVVSSKTSKIHLLVIISGLLSSNYEVYIYINVFGCHVVPTDNACCVWDVLQGAGLSDCRTVPGAGEASGSERLHHRWWNG